MPPGRSASRVPSRSSRGMRGTGHSSLRARSTSRPPSSSIDPDALRHLAEILLTQRHPGDARRRQESLSGRACKATSFPGLSTTQGRGSLPTRRPTCSIPFSAAARPDAASASACHARPGWSTQAGGRLRWSSNPGHGSVFQVHLPLVVSERTRDATRRSATVSGTGEQAAQELGDGRAKDHLVGDIVTVNAKKRHVEGLRVIPVVPLEPAVATAPRAQFRPDQDAEPLGQGRRVPRRPRANPPRLHGVQADFQMTFKAGQQGTMAIASALPHG